MGLFTKKIKIHALSVILMMPIYLILIILDLRQASCSYIEGLLSHGSLLNRL
jgi:hypothetical protein